MGIVLKLKLPYKAKLRTCIISCIIDSRPKMAMAISSLLAARVILLPLKLRLKHPSDLRKVKLIPVSALALLSAT